MLAFKKKKNLFAHWQRGKKNWPCASQMNLKICSNWVARVQDFEPMHAANACKCLVSMMHSVLHTQDHIWQVNLMPNAVTMLNGQQTQSKAMTGWLAIWVVDSHSLTGPNLMPIISNHQDAIFLRRCATRNWHWQCLAGPKPQQPETYNVLVVKGFQLTTFNHTNITPTWHSHEVLVSRFAPENWMALWIASRIRTERCEPMCFSCVLAPYSHSIQF